VSEADRSFEDLIVAGLSRLFPDDGFLGEEREKGSGLTRGSSGSRSCGRAGAGDSVNANAPPHQAG